MHRSILFVDCESSAPYALSDLANRGLGGTEASTLRVANALSRDCDVCIAQHQSVTQPHRTSGSSIVFRDFREVISCSGYQPEVVVAVRSRKIIPLLRKRFPASKLYLWVHCFPGKSWKRLGRELKESQAKAIAVSDTLKETLRQNLVRDLGPNEADRYLLTIFNPIEDELVPDGTERQHGRLLSLSSPHKGLSEVLTHFTAAKAELPHLQLKVCHPDYMRWDQDLPEGVELLGSLPRKKVIKELRVAQLLFYPQQSFAETFGLVLAEANAVGTPALTGQIGAAAEVLGDRSQILKKVSSKTVTSTLLDWEKNGFPVVSGNPYFRLSSVVRVWREHILNASSSDY